MIAIWFWLIPPVCCLPFSIFNVVRRTQNLKALREEDLDGDATLSARWLRHQEYVRMVQLLAVVLVGILALWLPRPPPQQMHGLIRFYTDTATGLFFVISYGLCYNILYAFRMGRRLDQRVYQREVEEWRH